MCQLCAIKQIAAQDRWPKPVEANKTDLYFLIDAIHDEYQAHETKKQKSSDVQPSAELLDMLKMLSQQLDVLESDREIWWTSPEERALRHKLEQDCDQKRLSELHKINNTTSSSIEALSAQLGSFCKWSLGMNGGVWELMHGDKVEKT